MLAYQVTIQIEQAFESDYSVLNDLMLRNGFFRSVRTGDGSWYELPPTEYEHFSAFDLSPNVVRDKVVTIAAKTGKRYSVIVLKQNASDRSVYSPPPDRDLGIV